MSLSEIPTAWPLFPEGLSSLLGCPILGVQRYISCTICIFWTIANQVVGNPTSETPMLLLLIQVDCLCQLAHILLTWFSVTRILRPGFFYMRAAHFLSIICTSWSSLPSTAAALPKTAGLFPFSLHEGNKILDAMAHALFNVSRK